MDKGSEFYNQQVKDLLLSYKINLYSTYSNLKASIVERFNRTLKEKMWKQFSLRGNYKWHDILQNLVSEYNNSIHRTIGLKPKDVTPENEALVLKKFDRLIPRKKKSKFKVGDKVRINKYKHVFEKGYTPNWTTEIFTVVEVVPTRPFTYKLKDYQNQPIAGGFYEQEMTRVANPDIYLVEKVLRKRGNQLYVKWLGFDNSHNSWINKNQI